MSVGGDEEESDSLLTDGPSASRSSLSRLLADCARFAAPTSPRWARNANHNVV